MRSPASHRVAAAVGLAVWATAGYAQAAPAPVHLHAVPGRVIGTGSSSHGAGALLRVVTVPALATFAVRRTSTAAALRTLPPFVAARPVRAGGAFFSGVGLVPALAPLFAGGCATRAQPGPIATLPPSPFDTRPCGRPGSDDAMTGLPPTSLVAGHDKNALYGPAYAPSNADLH